VESLSLLFLRVVPPAGIALGQLMLMFLGDVLNIASKIIMGHIQLVMKIAHRHFRLGFVMVEHHLIVISTRAPIPPTAARR